MKKRRKEAWLSIRQGVSSFLLRFAENEKKFSRPPYFARPPRVRRGGTAVRKGSEVTWRPRRHGVPNEETANARRCTPLKQFFPSACIGVHLRFHSRRPPWPSVSPSPPCNFGLPLFP